MKKSKLYGIDVRPLGVKPLGTEAPKSTTVKKSSRPRSPKIVGQSARSQDCVDPIDDSSCTPFLNLIQLATALDTSAVPQTLSEGTHVLMDDSKDAQMTTLTLKGLNKKGTAAFYGGARGVIRIPLIAFVDKTAPETFQTEEVFAPARSPKVKKVKLTPEQREAAKAARATARAEAKLARKNAPKPTAAERLAKAEARFNKLKAKLAGESGSEGVTTM